MRLQNTFRSITMLRNDNNLPKRVAIVALLLMCSAPALTHGQGAPSSSAPASSAPAPVLTPQPAMPGARLRKEQPETDIFDGLTYTEEQQVKIAQIRQKGKMHVDAVKKDQRLGPEEKQAMIDGYRRLEVNEIFRVLTPEQQAEVRKKIAEQRAALKQARQRPQQQQQQPPPQQQRPVPPQ